MNTFIVFVCMISIAKYASGQFLYVDDPCRTNAGATGKCKGISSCPVNMRGTGRPTLCGFDAGVPIVCCIENSGSYIGSTSRRPPTVTRQPTGPSRKADQMCQEYGKSVTHVISTVALLPDAVPQQTSIPKCKYSNTPLIVGGEEAQIGEFPHMAALGYRDSDSNSEEYAYDCGGILISQNHVLTAAHCLYHRVYGSPVRVRLGDHDLQSNDDKLTPQDIEIRADGVIPHPDYKFPSRYHDIALIRLSTPARFNDNVRPACLWTSDYIDSDNALATGWGELLPNSGLKPSALQKVTLNIIPQNQCAALPAFAPSDRRGGITRGLIREQMCAGDIQKGGKDTCRGDSGGPLQITKSNNRCVFIALGVTSFGTGCGNAKSPGVYTRVSAYLDWIEPIVWP